MTEENRFDSYDINSAFISNFTTQEFPLSTTDIDVYDLNKDVDIADFKPKHKHYIVGIKLYNRRQKYKGDYSGYLLNSSTMSGLQWSNKYMCLVGWICECDLEVIKLLFDYDKLSIVKYIGFNRYGKLSEAAYVALKYYNMRKTISDETERAAFKERVNSCCYGKLAWGNNYGKTTKDVVREPHCVVAMYEIAYTRLRMAKLLVEYIDKIVYIDSDSIRVLAGADTSTLAIGDKLGQFKCEWTNRQVYFIAPKQYIIYDEDGAGYECHICRVSDPLTQEQIDMLRRGECVVLDVKYKDETTKFTLKDQFHYVKNGNLGRYSQDAKV